MTRIPAIPTEYNGIRFRSRLEAKWACFFDLLGWKWAYEPIDLAGYIPDFIITVVSPDPSRDIGTKILVEVKPETDEDAIGVGILKKIRNSGWSDSILCVGASIFRHRDNGVAIGFFDLPKIFDVGFPVKVGLCICCQQFVLAEVSDNDPEDDPGQLDSHWCFFCNCATHNDAAHKGHFLRMTSTVERLWAVASNQTQWKKNGGEE